MPITDQHAREIDEKIIPGLLIRFTQMSAEDKSVFYHERKSYFRGFVFFCDSRGNYILRHQGCHTQLNLAVETLPNKEAILLFLRLEYNKDPTEALNEAFAAISEDPEKYGIGEWNQSKHFTFSVSSLKELSNKIGKLKRQYAFEAYCQIFEYDGEAPSFE